jgi:hypothetical protein
MLIPAGPSLQDNDSVVDHVEQSRGRKPPSLFELQAIGGAKQTDRPAATESSIASRRLKWSGSRPCGIVFSSGDVSVKRADFVGSSTVSGEWFDSTSRPVRLPFRKAS